MSETEKEKGKATAKTKAKPAKRAKAKRAKKKVPKGLTAFTEQGTAGPWITLARFIMVLALATTIPVILGIGDGRRYFWAAAIASLPLFWVVGGFHLWRRICPLAVFAQVGRYLGISGSRRMSGKLVTHYMVLQLGLMILALSLRLIMTNGTRWALVGFLIAAVILAIVTGLIFTGKTWCNYICPVGMVEKFYTEPIRLSGPKNSQCKPCTACKKNCPDIDLEQGYWKELDFPARRLAYFAWPGLVFAFYFYYYLLAGDWDFYFSGEWTRQDGQIQGWLSEGLFFLESVPVVVAAPFTLITFAGISFALFSLGEKIALGHVQRRSNDGDDGSSVETLSELVRHRTLAVAGFVGFIIFYWFGGQPTITKFPGWLGEGFAVVVVIAASAIFFRRWNRHQADFVKEKFAEKLLKKWEWGDNPPSDRLQDIYLLHSERTKERKNRLAAYKDTVREMVADGLVTKSELVILDSLRGQLGVTDKDHKRILGELSDEERQLFDPKYQGSLEERLQQQQYQREVRQVVITAARLGQSASADALSSLRDEYRISEDEESAAMNALMASDGPIAELFREQVAEIRTLQAAFTAARTEKTLSEDLASTSYSFFRNLCVQRARQRGHKAINLLVALAGERAPDDDVDHLQLFGVTPAVRAHTAETLQTLGVDGVDTLIELADGFESVDNGDSSDGKPASGAPFLALLKESSPPLRATVVHLLTRFDDGDSKAAVIAATDDEEPLVREAAFHALGVRGRLSRKLMAKAFADTDTRVQNATRATAKRASDADSTEAVLEVAESSKTRAVYATLDANRQISSLTSLEKMMLLSQVPLFSSLEPSDLEELSEIADERTFETGEFVCRQDEWADDVFVLISGAAEAWTETDGERRVLGLLKPGNCVGEMAVLDSSPRSANVSARIRTRTLALDGDDFRAMLATRPSMGQTIIEELVGRLRGMIEAG